MKQVLITELEKICPGKVFLQGTIAEGEAYPSSFITFWTSGTDDNAHYNNDVHSVDWHFDVFFYSSDPALVASEPPKIINLLRNKGFVPQGKGFDIPSDEPTHTGWAMQFIKTEIIERG